MRLNDINIKHIFTRVCDLCQKNDIFLTPTWNIRPKKRAFPFLQKFYKKKGFRLTPKSVYI